MIVIQKFPAWEKWGGQRGKYPLYLFQPVFLEVLLKYKY